MKLGDDPEVARWLGRRAGDEDLVEWDAGNRTKGKKHDVTTEEVEDVLRRPFVFEGRILEPAHPEPRWLLLGETSSGRRLALIFTRRGDHLRPISCRPMRAKEQSRYEDFR